MALIIKLERAEKENREHQAQVFFLEIKKYRSQSAVPVVTSITNVITI
jgi:hypothetical protein